MRGIARGRQARVGIRESVVREPVVREPVAPYINSILIFFIIIIIIIIIIVCVCVVCECLCVFICAHYINNIGKSGHLSLLRPPRTSLRTRPSRPVPGTMT